MVARWAYAIRLAAGAMPVAVYRRGGENVRMRSTGTRNLPAGARAAQARILELVDTERRTRLTASDHGSAGAGGGGVLRRSATCSGSRAVRRGTQESSRCNQIIKVQIRLRNLRRAADKEINGPNERNSHKRGCGDAWDQPEHTA